MLQFLIGAPAVQDARAALCSVDNAVESGLRLTQQGLEVNECLSLLKGDVLLRCVVAAEERVALSGLPSEPAASQPR